MKGLLNQLVENIQRWYNPRQYLSGDKGVFDFKGRHRARCYNPKKPAKWHFKAFCLNDAMTSYLCNFCLYQGEAEQRDLGYIATGILTKPDKFCNKGHILATDN